MSAEQSQASKPSAKAPKMDASLKILQEFEEAKDTQAQMLIMMKTLLSAKTSQDDLTSSSSRQFTEVNNKVDTLQTKVDGMGNKAEDFDKRLKALDTKDALTKYFSAPSAHKQGHGSQYFSAPLLCKQQQRLRELSSALGYV